MITPSDLYEIVDDSDLPGAPVMIVALTGYVDAGNAGSGLVDQLLDGLEHEVVARFDADLLVDYRARRPRVVFSEDHYSDYARPELLLRRVTDADGTAFLLLDGPEPDVMWERFTEAVAALVARWNVRLVVGFHGIPMGVPHTRPLGITVHGTRPELVTVVNPWEGEVRIPSHVGALLELRLGERGVDAVGYVAHVPHYLAEAEYPDASLSLAAAVSQGTGLQLPTEALEESAETTRSLVSAQVADSDDIQRVVRALEVQYDAYVGGTERGNLIASRSEVPDADQIGAELEKFLADLPGEDS